MRQWAVPLTILAVMGIYASVRMTGGGGST